MINARSLLMPDKEKYSKDCAIYYYELIYDDEERLSL